MSSAIKSMYQFIVSIQILCLIVFFGYLVDSGASLSIPISISLSSDYTFSYTIQFNYTSILIFISTLSGIIILSSIQVVGSGLSDEGSATIRKVVLFIAQFLILNIPIIFLISRDESLSQFSVFLTLIILIIHLLHFIEEQKGVNN